MSDVLDKLSSYNIFNYLLPGTLFAAAGSSYSSFEFRFDNLFIAGFACYFFGQKTTPRKMFRRISHCLRNDRFRRVLAS